MMIVVTYNRPFRIKGLFSESQKYIGTNRMYMVTPARIYVYMYICAWYKKYAITNEYVSTVPIQSHVFEDRIQSIP